MGTLIEIDPLDSSSIFGQGRCESNSIHLLKELFKVWVFVVVVFSLIVKMVMTEFVTDDFAKGF